MDVISRLCAWYQNQAVNDWHEDHGVKIDTLDNPGWLLKIDLDGTSLMTVPFEEVWIDRSDRDWINARKTGETFEAFGGANNLGEMIEIFLDWAA